MNEIQALLLTAAVIAVALYARLHGLLRKSFMEKVPGRDLHAVYERVGVLLWDLSIAAPGATAGIKQGRMTLPAARRLVAQVAEGKRSIL